MAVSVASSYSSNLTPSLGTSIYHGVQALKKIKTRKRACGILFEEEKNGHFELIAMQCLMPNIC